MVDDRDPCAPRQRSANAGDDRCRLRPRERHLRLDHPRSRLLGDVADRVAHRRVAVRKHEDLVPGGECQRAEHGVAAGGGVLDKGDVAAVGADEGAEAFGRRPQSLRKDLEEKAVWLGLHAFSPLLLNLQYSTWCGPERAVVHMQPPPIQQPFVTHGLA
jgi:hypothetical protein